ncbi:MAG: hypothetical protein JW995_05810 [Melioribacteraceae bacterium]|nr:hypothetical protein [Melioribacteraceae bacterium]
MNKKLVLLITLFLAVEAAGQNKDPYKLLDGVKNKFNTIEDYIVDASIKVDVNFLRVPEAKAKIYFKQPDHVKMESEGFAMLPRQGLNYSPAKLLESDFSAIYVKSDTLDNHITDIVKVIPNNDSSDVILSTLWIDHELDIVRKIESTTKKSGTVEIHLYYDDEFSFALPVKVKFSFNVTNMELPAAITGDFEGEQRTQNKSKSPMSGTVTVDYSNYQVNKGLDDSIFLKNETR